MTKCYAITAAKANRLYWLGRYAERAYTSLHVLRQLYDEMIDCSTADISEDQTVNEYIFSEGSRLDQMYSAENGSSMLRCLEAANDNAIVLRDEIKSESLSYIQMSLVHIKECAAAHESNITALQPITDHLLAFFGSIEERVQDDRIHNIILMGKLVENMDMHIRLDYPYDRIAHTHDQLKKCIEAEFGVSDIVAFHKLDDLLKGGHDHLDNNDYKNRVLESLNQVVNL